MQLYERHTATEEGTESAEGSLHGVEPKQVVARCLQLLHLLFLYHSHIVEAISVTAHFARVCCVFLSGDALFLDATIQTSLQQILRLVLQRPHELDLTADVPGLSSFTDLYTQLLDQFEGVSYGDPLFGAVIMVPLQPRHPAQLRRLVWMQRTHVLRCITTKPEQMLVDMGEYLTSTETDDSVRKAYLRALASGQVNNVRNPAMFQIATALSSAV